MRPSVKQLREKKSNYPDWKICERCNGGRGEVYPTISPETGETIWNIRVCELCGGERVMPVV